jgi:hypothetical protein
MALAAVIAPAFWRWSSRHSLFWIALAWCAYALIRAQMSTL